MVDLVPAERYALVEVFSGIGDYKMICEGNSSRSLFQDMAGVVNGAFEQLCENHWGEINADFDLEAYRERYVADTTSQLVDWPCRDLIALMPHLLTKHAIALENEETDSALGDWSDLVKDVTDDLNVEDGIQISEEMDAPRFARWLLEWEQERWVQDSRVPGWWLRLRDLLKERRWYVDERKLREFARIVEIFNKANEFY